LFQEAEMMRLAATCLSMLVFLGGPAWAEICHGSEREADVFVHVEICPAGSRRACTAICLTPDLYETQAGAGTLARFIFAVGDGGVSLEQARSAACGKFGTGRNHAVGNVVVSPQLCRNAPGTERIVCDF